MEKIFVLGGTGFLGYYTVKELLKRGYQVETVALPPMPEEAYCRQKLNVHLGILVRCQMMK